MIATATKLRPSALPKLAACARFQGEENAGEAARRGTAMDAQFRGALAGGMVLEPTNEDDRAVAWAVETTLVLADGAPVLCAVSAPSSLAIDVAKRFRMTLIGFLRGDRFSIYSGAERIRSVT